MANTYTQIYMHIVFAVSRRESLISRKWEEELHGYLAGACRNRQHFVHAINGTADHVHLFIGMHPAESVSQLVQTLKVQSSRWINDRFMHGKFSWQSGFGAFSYSRSLVEPVVKYIENQKEHHRSITFQEELAEMFEKAGVKYVPAYMMQGFADASKDE
ncbi:MAG: IS200/IS605 family transposase [Prevotella sp.]|nr:IS200/IS605 family transposase [Prevotella sp.]MBR6494100.1 IS200/IS605 family transposase [Prevotella sp.]